MDEWKLIIDFFLYYGMYCLSNGNKTLLDRWSKLSPQEKLKYIEQYNRETSHTVNDTFLTDSLARKCLTWLHDELLLCYRSFFRRVWPGQLPDDRDRPGRKYHHFRQKYATEVEGCQHNTYVEIAADSEESITVSYCEHCQIYQDVNSSGKVRYTRRTDPIYFLNRLDTIEQRRAYAYFQREWASF